MAGIMLVAFASSGLIPAGFMPASGRPFLLQVCWDGLPAGMLAQLEPSPADSSGMESMGMGPMPMDGPRQGPHHHHHGSPGEHCVFAAVCSAGPIPHLPLPGDFSSILSLLAIAFASIALAVRVVHLPQPRAPPARLS